MPPRIRSIIIEEAVRHNATFDEIIVTKRRLRHVVEARKAIIARLYDPSTCGRYQGHKSGSASTISRYLRLDHTTVIHHVKAMGIHMGDRK